MADDERNWNYDDASPEEAEALGAHLASADMRWLEVARAMVRYDPAGLKPSPHHEYLQTLLDRYGMGDNSDEGSDDD